MGDKKISRKYLVFYTIALIGFATLLILMSLSSQIRAEKQTEEFRLEAAESASEKAGALQNAQQHYEANLQLSARNQQLELDLAEQQTQNTQLNSQVKAYQQYLSIFKAYKDRRYSAARELVAAFEDEGLQQHLDPQTKEEYDDVLKAIKY